MFGDRTGINPRATNRKPPKDGWQSVRFSGLRKSSTDVYVRALLIALFLCACTPTPTPPPAPIPATATATQTVLPPTSTQTFVPSPTAMPTIAPTQTPIPCYVTEDLCIEDSHFLLSRPISDAYANEIHHGYRYGSTINGEREPHHGVEFVNASGTPVLAAADGRVVYAAEDKAGTYSFWDGFYGNLVIIEHDMPELDKPLYTLYAHLSIIGVAEGEIVKAGQPIGEVGWTGRAIGSHLHFEVRLGGLGYSDTRNPELWLKPLADENGAIVARIVNQNGTVRRVTLNVDDIGDGQSAYKWVASLEAYAPETDPVGVDDAWQESHAIGDLPAGQYRLSFMYAGGYWERFVEVHPQKVTVVDFVIQE